MNRDPRLDPRRKSTSLSLNELIPLISKSQKDGPVVSSTHTSRQETGLEVRVLLTKRP